MPATLIEMGFITTQSEAELMAYSPQLFAQGIYQGIRRFIGV
jgi:N-acetylmuramoyl-L-alanine amidase